MERKCLWNDGKWRNKEMKGKTIEEMKKKAITLIKEFITDKKLNSLDDLKNYSFWGILNDRKYNGVSSDENQFDGDRTKIVYAIEFLLFHDSLPDFSIPSYPLSSIHSNYTGETINPEIKNTILLDSLFEKK